MPFVRAICAALLFAWAGACGSDVTLATRFAPGFSGASQHAVSVLGVYKDGQMSTEAWGELGPRISSALGAASCEAAFTEALFKRFEPVASALSDYVRANGPTDSLLAQLAPAAQGDLILVLIVAGKLPTPQKVSVQEGPSPGARGWAGGHAGQRVPGRGAGRERVDENVLQLSASFFSVKDKTSVALVDLKYSGQSVDEAISRFTQRLRTALPSLACAGWSFGDKVNAESIRSLAE